MKLRKVSAVEEYRSEEDSIKTALITAQKMADRIAKDAKEKAEEKLSASAATAQQTVTDAKEKADKMVAEARTYAANFTKEKQDAAESITPISMCCSSKLASSLLAFG